jgi:hypothetical protein
MRANIPTLNNYRTNSLDIEYQRQQILEEALLLNPEVEQGEYLLMAALYGTMAVILCG